MATITYSPISPLSPSFPNSPLPHKPSNTHPLSFTPSTLFKTIESLALSPSPNQHLITSLWTMLQELESQGVIGYARLKTWILAHRRVVRRVRLESLSDHNQDEDGDGDEYVLGKVPGWMGWWTSRKRDQKAQTSSTGKYRRYAAGCMVLLDGWRFRDLARAYFEVVEVVVGRYRGFSGEEEGVEGQRRDSGVFMEGG